MCVYNRDLCLKQVSMAPVDFAVMQDATDEVRYVITLQ